MGKLGRNLPDILFDIEENTAIREEKQVTLKDVIQTNGENGFIRAENFAIREEKQVTLKDDIQTDGENGFVRAENAKCLESTQMVNSNTNDMHDVISTENRIAMRDKSRISHGRKDDMLPDDSVLSDVTLQEEHSIFKHKLRKDVAGCDVPGILFQENIENGVDTSLNMDEICFPIEQNYGTTLDSSDASNEQVFDCADIQCVAAEEHAHQHQENEIGLRKPVTSPDDHEDKLTKEMLQKLMEIKAKWKHFCDTTACLDENANVEEMDKLFHSMGLSLDTPREQSGKPPETPKPDGQVKSIQEIINLGVEAKTSQPQTYSHVFVKYRKNKTVITGSQIPLHRVMSTLFDPKKLQIQHMDKWANVDNGSKRFVYGMEGVMSIVHAYSMKNELFALKNGKLPDCGPYDGLADIIWQSGDGHSAIVVECEPQFSYTSLFECLNAKICFNLNELRSQLASVYSSPQPPISLVLSVVLTRGLDRIQGDLASSKMKTLLTQDGDETWSLILLLLIGQAVGHIMHTQFPKNWDPIRSPIGILSLDEYGEKVYVSPFFKTPRFPVWLLHYSHDGNHYSLLFGHCRQLLSDWKEEKNFTLHHWDFDDQKMKTVQIRTTGRITQDPEEVKDVLEMIVRTKWPIANIDIKPSGGQKNGGLSVAQFPSLRQRLFSRPQPELVEPRSYF